MKIDSVIFSYAVYAAGRIKGLDSLVSKLPFTLGREALPEFLRAFPPSMVVRHGAIYEFFRHAKPKEVEHFLGKGVFFVDKVRRNLGFVDMLLALGVRAGREELLNYFALYAYLKQLRFGLELRAVLSGDPDEEALFEELKIRVEVTADKGVVKGRASQIFVEKMCGARPSDIWQGKEPLHEALFCLSSLSGLSRLMVDQPLTADNVSRMVIGMQPYLEAVTKSDGISGDSILKETESYREALTLAAFCEEVLGAYRDANASFWKEHERAEELSSKLSAMRDKIQSESASKRAEILQAVADRQARLNDLQLAYDKLRMELDETRARLADMRHV